MKFTLWPFLLLFFYGICKELSDLFLTFSHKLVEYLRSIHDLRLHFQYFADLPGDQGLACSWGTMKKHSLDVFDAKSAYHFRMKHSSVEHSSFNQFQLLFQTSHF